MVFRQGIPFGGFLMALAYSGVQFLTPWLEMRASQSWPEVACAPIAAKNQAELRYSYEFNGVRHESERLSLYKSPPKNLEELREKFRRGETVTGYVNPSDPTVAVLSRHDANDESLGLVVMGIVVVVFCSGFAAAWLSGMDKWTAAKAGREKKVSPVTRFCECVVYATLVNSFVGIFFVVIANIEGELPIKAFMYLFLTPFALLGLLMIYAVFRNFMLIFTEDRSSKATGQ